MNHTKNDLPEKIRVQVAKLLQDCLVDAIDLMMHAKQAHWTVKGMQFIALHELFDQISENAEERVDLLAERIAQLGGTPEGTTRVVAKTSRLQEYPLKIKGGKDHVLALSEAISTHGRHVRAAIQQSNDLSDLDTADLFTEVSRGLDKDLWLLEAHVQDEA